LLIIIIITYSVLYLENSFSTTTDDLVHLGIIQQLKKKDQNLPLAKFSSMHACSMREKRNHRIQIVPDRWVCHECGVLEESLEWLL